ncbi:hypothetical protein Tco_1076364, partial [Tanacetum coccineum]
GEEGSSKPKTKRRKTSAIRKGQTASSGGSTSPTPIWTAPSVDNTLVIHSKDEEEDAGENLRRSHPWSSPHNVLENLDEADHVSPHRSVDESIHNYIDVDADANREDKEDTPQRGSFVNLSGHP